MEQPYKIDKIDKIAYTINMKNEKLVCYERLTAAVCYKSSLQAELNHTKKKSQQKI